EMARFAPATQQAIDRYYSPGQGQNPVDFGGRRFDDAADVSKATAEIVAADPNTDALLYSITTAPMMVKLAEELAAGMLDEQGRLRKPALWVMQPGRAADGARQALRERGIAFTNHTGEAIDALVAWQARSRFVARSEA